MAGCDDVDGIMSELEADPDDHFDSFGIFLNSSSKSLRQSSKSMYIFLGHVFNLCLFSPWGPFKTGRWMQGTELAAADFSPGSKCPKRATQLQPGRGGHA